MPPKKRGPALNPRQNNRFVSSKPSQEEIYKRDIDSLKKSAADVQARHNEDVLKMTTQHGEELRKLQQDLQEMQVEFAANSAAHDTLKKSYGKLHASVHELQNKLQEKSDENATLRAENLALKESLSVSHEENVAEKKRCKEQVNSQITLTTAEMKPKRHALSKFVYKTKASKKYFVHAPVPEAKHGQQVSNSTLIRRSTGIGEYISFVSTGKADTNLVDSSCRETLCHFVHANKEAVFTALEHNGVRMRVPKGGTLCLQSWLSLSNKSVKELRRLFVAMGLPGVLESDADVLQQRKELFKVLEFYELENVDMHVAKTANSTSESVASDTGQLLEEVDIPVMRIREGGVFPFVKHIVHDLCDQKALIFPNKNTCPLWVEDRVSSFCCMGPCSSQHYRLLDEIWEARMKVEKARSTFEAAQKQEQEDDTQLAPVCIQHFT